MNVKALGEVPDGAILVLHIRYANQEQRNPQAAPVYTYAALKAGGLWYLTGTGRVPQAAGWGAVEKWLERDGRELVRAELVTSQRAVWPFSDAVAGQVGNDQTEAERMDELIAEQPFSPGV
jgi:hypothetical protein